MHLDYLEAGPRIVTTTFYQVILLFLLYFDFYQTNSFFNFSYQKEKNVIVLCICGPFCVHCLFLFCSLGSLRVAMNMDLNVLLEKVIWWCF